MISKTTFPVRYYETDCMKVVHHSNYIRYFECARDALLNDLNYPIDQMEKDGAYVVVVGVECHYKHSAKMGDTLTATAEVRDVPLAKMRIYQSVVNQDGDLCAEGVVTLGFLDTVSYRPVPCPKRLLDAFHAKMDGEAPKA